jgi:hypothetical protein
MKVIKKINEIRHIIPDGKKVYLYAGLSLIACIISKIANLKGNMELATDCVWYSSCCIAFEYYFMVKSTIKEYKQYKQKEIEIKMMLINAKLKAQIPLERFEIKMILKKTRKDIKKLEKKI